MVLEEEKSVIKPFEIGVEKDLKDPIKPFEIDQDYIQERERQVNTNFEKEHPKEQEDEQSESSHALETIPRTQMQMIRPFDYICEDAVNVAEALAGDDYTLARCLAQALNQYSFEGGDIRHLVEKIKKPKNGAVN